MPSLFRTAIAVIFLSAPTWSQERAPDPSPQETPEEQPADAEQPEQPATPEQPEQDEAGAADTEAESAADSAEGEAPVVDDDENSVLDDQTFEGEDDDFIPTEEIPVNEPIPFPSDI